MNEVEKLAKMADDAAFDAWVMDAAIRAVAAIGTATTEQMGGVACVLARIACTLQARHVSKQPTEVWADLRSAADAYIAQYDDA